MSSQATSPPVSLWKHYWIISAPADLTLFIGSAIVSYFVLWLQVGLGVPTIILFWIWSLGFDGPHIFGTITRTYLDREERQQRGRLLWGSLGVFFSLGPLLILLGLKPLLILIIATWAYYHLLRQHYGFMILYKKKNSDLAGWDNRLDRLFLAAMMLYPPFQRFFIYRVTEMGIPAQYALAKLLPWLDPLLKVGLIAIGLAFVVRQIQQLVAGQALNLPKYLFLLSVIPLHWLTFHYLGPRESVPVLTIFHNIQYHGIIWYYNRNRYRPSAEATQRYGWGPSWLTSHFSYYIIVGIAFSLLYRIPGFWLGNHYDLAFGLFAGFGLTHYYLDSRIWRVRHDEQLSNTLKLST